MTNDALHTSDPVQSNMTGEQVLGLINQMVAEGKAKRFVELDLDEAKRLLDRAVEEMGDQHIYPHAGAECVYFDPETKAPSCLIGYVLSYKGITALDMDFQFANKSTDVHDLVEARILRADLETESLLYLAQEYQDGGYTWGRSVKNALDEYEDRARNLMGEEADEDEDYPF